MKCFTLFSIILLAGTASAQHQTIPPPPVQGWVQLTSGVTAGLSHISLVGPDTVYVSGDTLLRSTDAGATWQGLAGAPASSGVLYFRDDTTGFLVSNGTVYKTINGGQTWVNVGGGYAGAIQFTGSDTGWTFNEGYLTRSTDDGNTWQNFGQTIAGSDANCISFANASRGYMMGIARIWPPNPQVSAAEWFGTFDGGKTWSGGYASPGQDVNGKQHSGIPGVVYSLATFGTDTVISVGSQIGRTIDGGTNWDTIAFPASCLLQSIYFSDREHGTAVGSRDVIVHTTDGGSTWELENSGITDGTYLYSVKFVDSLTGYVVGEDGIILRTGNGGLSWVKLIPGVDSVTGTVYPNPANANASVSYSIPILQHVSLALLSVSGATEETFYHDVPQEGWQSVSFDTSKLPTGTYFIKIVGDYCYGILKLQVSHDLP